MSTVLTSISLSRFQRYGVSIPSRWRIISLPRPFTEADVMELGQEADFLLVSSSAKHPVTAKAVASCPRLKLIQLEGAGYDNVDIQAAARAGIPVANTRGANADAVAELAVGLMISLLRRPHLTDREIKAGRFTPCRAKYQETGARQLSGCRVGLIGCGAIGRRAAEMLKIFKADLYYNDLLPLPAAEEERLGLRFLEMEKLLASCDLVSLHVPLTEGTRNMMDAGRLALMKAGAFLVNTSRGEVVSPEGLASALEEGRLAGAALDVMSPEPPEAKHPLLTLSPQAADRLLLTPHIAGTTDESWPLMLGAALENIIRVENGLAPVNVIN